MHLGITKPDYGIIGGFELVLGRIAQELESMGHRVSWLTVDVAALTRRVYGVAVPDDVWEAAPEFFRYLSLAEAFTRLDTSGVDMVLSTQPPSFAVDHPRHLSLFFHHLRIYYDLSDVYVASGHAEHLHLHEAARRRIRQIDDALLRRPGWILAGSEIVRERLRSFHGLDDNVGVFHAGVGVPQSVPDEERTYSEPLCVSRHEFPKRTELFVHAMKLLPDLHATVVGGGGRLPYVQALDARMTHGKIDPHEVDATRLWLCRHDGHRPESPAAHSNVRFLGHVDDGALARLYSKALCVVAPAYLEDYGLTAIEAMHHGKPVIVCSDGGGLTSFVEDGVNGFVVEPDGRAIAAAVQKLHDDHGLARTLGEAARQTAATFTWERAMREILDAMERV